MERRLEIESAKGSGVKVEMGTECAVGLKVEWRMEWIAKC